MSLSHHTAVSESVQEHATEEGFASAGFPESTWPESVHLEIAEALPNVEPTPEELDAEYRSWVARRLAELSGFAVSMAVSLAKRGDAAVNTYGLTLEEFVVAASADLVRRGLSVPPAMPLRKAR